VKIKWQNKENVKSIFYILIKIFPTGKIDVLRIKIRLFIIYDKDPPNILRQ
jgi:hypothetical protein